MSTPKKKADKLEAKSGELRDALKDVIGRAPKSISIEFDKPAASKAKAIKDEERPWSGNIYKYNY